MLQAIGFKSMCGSIRLDEWLRRYSSLKQAGSDLQCSVPAQVVDSWFTVAVCFCLILMSYSWCLTVSCTFSVFAFVYNSLMIKSTKNISNWTTVTFTSEYIQWLIIHTHAHCLLHTVTNSCMWGTAPWRSTSHFCKSEKSWKCSKNQTKTRYFNTKWNLV